MATERKPEKPKWKERHERIPKEDVDILDYHPLIMKELHKLAGDYGKFVWQYEHELVQEGYIGLMNAWEKYDPERGTFVTIAYLRVQTKMGRELVKHIKEYIKLNHLEDIKFMDGDSMMWEDIFPSNEVDYEAVCKLACKDAIDVELVYGLVNGVTKKDMPVWIGTTHKEMLRRYKALREEMIAVVNELYEGEDKR